MERPIFVQHVVESAVVSVLEKKLFFPVLLIVTRDDSRLIVVTEDLRKIALWPNSSRTPV